MFRVSGFGFRISHLGDRLPVVLFRCAPPSANQEIELWPSTLKIKKFHKALPHTSVLLLATEKDRDQLFQALEAGVSGWLQKPCTADQIVRAILILHEGGLSALQ